MSNKEKGNVSGKKNLFENSFGFGLQLILLFSKLKFPFGFQSEAYKKPLFKREISIYSLKKSLIS